MKQLLIFLCLLFFACFVDLRPVVLQDIESDAIHVQVTGAVESEETVTLPLYSTMADLFNKIILKDNADTSSFNPQTVLKDHDVVNVPIISKESAPKKISINTGTLEELCSLPGIGEGTAQRIIVERETNGLFQSIEDLTRVKGIGEAKLEKLRDQICL